MEPKMRAKTSAMRAKTTAMRAKTRKAVKVVVAKVNVAETHKAR
jgi:hypothetical protein